MNDKEHWKRLQVSHEAARETFASLVSAVFLNDMYFRVDQDWPPLVGQTNRFTRAFKALNVFALNDYISFLGTIGGALLPGAWVEISNCVRHLVKRAGKSFLTGSSAGHLLRLVSREASLHRVPDDDRATWGGIVYLLDVLADAGFAEAFRLRESLARFSG